MQEGLQLLLAQAHSEIICGLFFLADHKKMYGEEHGSCQAGIAGVFTEVSDSARLYVRW